VAAPTGCDPRARPRSLGRDGLGIHRRSLVDSTMPPSIGIISLSSELADRWRNVYIVHYHVISLSDML
jgi:hypothetical protein